MALRDSPRGKLQASPDLYRVGRISQCSGLADIRISSDDIAIPFVL